MATGDGLLARLTPSETRFTAEMLTGLCAAAEACGNGIVEITQRGALQIRGLRPDTVAPFQEAVTALGIGADASIPVICSPLSGLDPSEVADLRPLAAELRAAIATARLAPQLAPKVSVLVDGGGSLHLDALAADIRLAAEATAGTVRYRLAIGGTAADATLLGSVSREEVVAAVVAILRLIVARGRRARARDLLTTEAVGGIRAALGIGLTDVLQPPRPPADPLGTHPVGDGRVAVGVGMAFGHIRAPLLAALVAHAVAAGAHSFVPAGRRVLLALGLPAEKAADFATAAERRGFVARVDDPRRFLAACAGAPDCPSGRMAARRVALEFTEILAPILDGSFEIHVSGCAKGCAHPGPAAVTLVGTDQGCGVVLAGRADGTPVGALPPGDLPRSLAQFARSIVESRRSGERSGDVLRRLGGEAVSALLIGETADG